MSRSCSNHLITPMQILGELANRVPLGGVMTQLEDLDRQIALASPKVSPPIFYCSHP